MARRVSESWAIGIDPGYQSRVEDEDLVLWGRGRTVLVAPWGPRPNDTRSRRVQLEVLLRDAPPDREVVLDVEDERYLRHAYLLREPEEGGRWALYSHTMAESGMLQLAVFYDLLRDREWAAGVVESVRHRPDPMVSVADPVGPEGWYVFASNKVVGPQAEPVRYAYHEPADLPTFSGWHFFYGDETDEEANDPYASSRVTLTSFLQSDPSLRDLVGLSERCAWERDTGGSPWRRLAAP